MKKLIFLTAVTLFTTVVSLAQKSDNKLKLSVGPELAFASGGFSNTHSFGIGGTAQLEIKMQEKLMGVAYGGIIFYNGKSAGSGIKSKGVTIVPVRVGIKYYLSGSIYAGFQAGLGFVQGPDPYTLSNITYSYQGTAFSYSPQIGYEFQTNSGKSIDATLKYDGYAKSGGGIGSFGLRVAYIF
jgi:hypothetical protein